MEGFYVDDSLDMEWIKREMEEVKSSVQDRFNDILHPHYIEDFLVVLATAWNCNCQHANRIAREFKISLKEFVAIEGDVDLFIKIQLAEMFG